MGHVLVSRPRRHGRGIRGARRTHEHRSRTQPVRQGGEPGRPGLPRQPAPRDPGPQRLDVPARGLHCGPRRRRPEPGAAHRHAEEHRVRLRQGEGRRLPRGVRPRARRPSPGGVRRCDGGPDRGRGVRLGPHHRRRIRPRPRLRPARGRHPHHRRDPRRQRGAAPGLGGVGPEGPRRPEVHRLGVQGVPQGPLHHVGRGRRPHPRHLARRPVALRSARTPTGTRPSTTSARSSSRPSP